jgi:DNA adenine methylase
MIKPALKYAGGKNKLAGTIHRLSPPTILDDPVNGYIHRTYAYGGGLGEMWNWDYEGVSEIANDIDLNIGNFWRVLQGQASFEQFKRIIEATPFSRFEFEAARIAVPEDSIPNIPAAVNFFIRCRQSRSGGLKTFAPITKRRTRRKMNEQASAWWTAIDGLAIVRERLKRIAIEWIDAIDFLTQEDTPRTFHYCDPPYFPGSKTVHDTYQFEMSEDDHARLLATLKLLNGKVMLSGYRNWLYDELLSKWRRIDINVTNSMASGRSKGRKIESIWMNYDPR